MGWLARLRGDPGYSSGRSGDSTGAHCEACGRDYGSGSCVPSALTDRDGSPVARLRCGDGVVERLAACSAALAISSPISPSLDECDDCLVKPGEYHHAGCSLEPCPRCRTPLRRCGCFAGGRSASAQIAECLRWIAGAISIENHPEEERPLLLAEALLAWRMPPPLVLLSLRDTEGRPVPIPRQALDKRLPGGSPGVCHQCGRDGEVHRCAGCPRRFHSPRCDGYRLNQSLFCYECAASPQTNQRLALLRFARVLWWIAAAASRDETSAVPSSPT